MQVSQSSQLLATQALAARSENIGKELQGDAGKTADVAKRLEAVFASMLIKEMRNASPGSFFGTDSASDVYGGWFDEHIGQALAERGSLHVAEFVERMIQSNTKGEQP
jgi:Rod binding domain-containing protein